MIKFQLLKDNILKTPLCFHVADIINDWQPQSDINLIENGTQRLIHKDPANFILLNVLFYDK